MKALLITGPVGVGKTTVAEAVGARLAEAKVPHAVIGLDWLSACWPAPAARGTPRPSARSSTSAG